VRLTDEPAAGAAGIGTAQIAAINIARVAFPNCFTVPTFSLTVAANRSIRPSLPQAKNHRGQSFTLCGPQGQQTFTKTVRCRYRLLAASGRAAETYCIPPANHHAVRLMQLTGVSDGSLCIQEKQFLSE